MSVQMVLLPVFVLVGLTFALLLGMMRTRRGDTGGPNRATQLADCYRDQFELPVLFYLLIALALPLRRADLVIVMLSWVFVVTRFAHVGIFVTSNDSAPRSTAWLASALVLFAMWLYFALKLLLLI
ncbi:MULTISPECIES: MAPEG family protein [unclassified Bradyrhizobium]|uniref:MAPEG family protein n=1 Tax=unclassified Bradyrhizobium TaxID=2631580 RepID=UPI00102E4659|nr:MULTISPECIES: MAPEG family protein [unclassified Bradyrhizobium]MDI4238350.1 MAPEG family protein [Bradyrhizobium sp. Arg237L]TAI59846.1 hypothetical protein CWO89_43980 [Bradyrhizobium sp. Leo170]